MLVRDAGASYALVGAVSCVGLERETGPRGRIESKVTFEAQPVRP
jgi:hypothetical protein